jgi:hypothetical protein
MKITDYEKEFNFKLYRHKAYQEYKCISGLSSEDMDTWIKINPFVNEWIDKRAKEISSEI